MGHSSPTAALRALLDSLPPRPFQKDDLDRLVAAALEDTPSKFSSDVRRGQWELALKTEIFTLAAKEGQALSDPETTYYDELEDRLELVLTFTEQDACEQSFPFLTLQDLLETQTIPSCSHIFSWIEARAARLTANMVPQKGKALVLLRTLNDLLRRLSKMGSNTIFCGRILTFLSGVFPLGERSGVNLRGEYGPMWESVKFPLEVEKMEVEAEAKPEEAMAVDDTPVEKAKQTEAEKKEDFYNTFWSLQLPFSKPSLFAAPQTFNEFQEAVNKALPVIKEATVKERALTGSRSVMTGAAAANPLKRKRETDSPTEQTAGNEYFFAKFLTSPDLLDLEIADTHFRRQVLLQLLVLLHHLQTFTKEAKASWVSPRNRSLQMEFTLEGDAAQWVADTIARAHEELRQTAPAGRIFADAVASVLERERNWVRWKNDLCAPFDREPEPGPGLEEQTRPAREAMRAEPEEWPHALGSAPLTEIWEMGYRDLRDLENPFQPGDVKDFVKKIKLEDTRIEMRKKALARQAERIAAARAKAAAAAAAPPPALSTQESSVAAAEQGKPATPTPTPAGSQMHPSLPAKPGSAGGSEPSPSQSQSQPTPTPPPATPTPATPAPATPAAERVSTPAPAPPPVATPPDEQIAKLEENKQRWAWLALRTARDQHLALFGKIGTGDVVALAAEIEREREREAREREAAVAAAAQAQMQTDERTLEDARADSSEAGKDADAPKDVEGDVKMES